MKIFLIGLLLIGCGCPATTTVRPNECHDMCYPRKVEKYTKDGCYCTDGQPTQKVPVVEEPEKK